MSLFAIPFFLLLFNATSQTNPAEPPNLAREVGLRFFVPKSAALLQWERRAESNVYPPDHIGRPLGSTRAHADHGSQLPPTWPWGQDNSPMGSNDFRSTKRNILWAAQ